MGCKVLATLAGRDFYALFPIDLAFLPAVVSKWLLRPGAASVGGSLVWDFEGVNRQGG